MRIGIDTGGTFTDFVLEKEGDLQFHKIASTPHDPAVAVIQGVGELCGSLQPGDEAIHGSTVATNGFLERRGARTAVVVTRGFRDLLFIGRQDRAELYNLEVKRPSPFIRRSWIFQLAERTTAPGTVLRRPAKEELRRLRARIAQGGFRSIAVGFLHSYARDENEALVGRALRDLGLPVSLSSEVLPEFREYERLSATCMNAYLGPLLSQYLFELNRRLHPALLRMQQSNGGHMSIAEAALRPVHSILSGPAGGLAGARKIADILGERRIITLDMGGTSTDVALSEGGLPYTREYHLDGYPVGVQVLDIHTIGAGGGSIAWLDTGGALRVGPRSAGADPGPACYGKGNELTVTDAHLFLGRLLPDYFLGGRLPLNAERTQRCMNTLARQLGVSPLRAAEGIIAVANANMSRALRAVSVERGHDPRDYVLLCLGGASGLHACELAQELNIGRIMLPVAAGVLSALGMLAAGHRRDLSRTVLLGENQLEHGRLEALFQEIEAQGRRELADSGIEPRDFSSFRRLDVRYQGQSYEITLPYSLDFIEAFHQEHGRLYDHSFSERRVEVTTLRLALKTPPPPFSLPLLKRSGTGGPLQYRRLYYAGRFLDAAVLPRSSLHPDEPLAGPALVVDESSTCLVAPGFTVKGDIHGNLHLERNN